MACEEGVLLWQPGVGDAVAESWMAGLLDEPPAVDAAAPAGMPCGAGVQAAATGRHPSTAAERAEASQREAATAAAGLALGAYASWQEAQAVRRGEAAAARRRAQAAAARAALEGAKEGGEAGVPTLAGEAGAEPAPLLTPAEEDEAEAQHPAIRRVFDFDDHLDSVFSDDAIGVSAGVSDMDASLSEVSWLLGGGDSPMAGMKTELEDSLMSLVPQEDAPCSELPSASELSATAPTPKAATAARRPDPSSLREKAAAAKARARAAAAAACEAADRARAMIEVVSGAEQVEAAKGALAAPAPVPGSHVPADPLDGESDDGEEDSSGMSGLASRERSSGKRQPKAVVRFGDSPAADGGGKRSAAADAAGKAPAKRARLREVAGGAAKKPAAAAAAPPRTPSPTAPAGGAGGWDEGGIYPEGGPRRGCLYCHRQQTPQWRLGPTGPKTLCNACGVRWMKSLRGKATFVLPPDAC